ncbi:metal ABC transporter solute-binding protein, Zn/Mn family [Sabulicella rubraurantiaca]|uniref:metal ABC transporter solute-binding protein, Zn/Mn family n=1 Tax=Sabulicella rubraurantiaca TaxID=2811429 RepID=UPI001F17F5BE|nr:zinc ABC transporter substrate-binding protein [Sabulicella rubraurantiaca]
MISRRTLPLLAVSRPALARAATPPVAVASFSILGDMARQVAGQGWEIRTLAGPDVDAHHFQPRPSDAEALRGATVAIRNGASFDGWFDRLLRGAGFRGRLVTTTEGLTLRGAAARGGHSHGHSDPHAWQDAHLATNYARRIAEALDADPSHFLVRLTALDEEIRAAIATVPEERRVVVTSHDAFGYYGAAYGVRFLAPQGASTGAEPSAQQVAALIRQIRQGNITAVFMENIGNPATLRRLAAEAGVQVRGRLFADALSPPDGPATTYEAMMRHNTRLLVSAMRNDPA